MARLSIRLSHGIDVSLGRRRIEACTLLDFPIYTPAFSSEVAFESVEPTVQMKSINTPSRLLSIRSRNKTNRATPPTHPRIDSYATSYRLWRYARLCHALAHGSSACAVHRTNCAGRRACNHPPFHRSLPALGRSRDVSSKPLWYPGDELMWTVLLELTTMGWAR